VGSSGNTVAVPTLAAGGFAMAEARHGEDALRVIERTAEFGSPTTLTSLPGFIALLGSKPGLS
jgi:hypothetical protein